MSRFFKDKVKQVFSSFGFIFEKKNALNSEAMLLRSLLGRLQVDAVLDVGANTGQFGLELKESGFSGKIVSFEPLPKVYEQLATRAAGHTNWHTENMAVGNEDGTIEINISANTESSSILPMLESHASLAPESIYIGKATVPITRLDTWYSQHPVGKKLFLKIDVQGFEWGVLQGARSLFEHVELLQLELSFIPLYAHSRLYYELMQDLENAGFSFFSMLPAFSDYKTGQVFQVDALYVKKRKPVS